MEPRNYTDVQYQEHLARLARQPLTELQWALSLIEREQACCPNYNTLANCLQLRALYAEAISGQLAQRPSASPR